MPNKVKQYANKAGNAVKSGAKRVAKAAVNEAKREIRRELSKGAGGVAKDLARAALIVGSGDYVTNSLVKGHQKAAPSFGNTQSRFKRREFLGQVVSSSTVGAFKLDKFTVNPAIPSTFPWLSNIARNFESWRPHGFVIEFKSTSGTAINSANSALGKVIMAAQYNPYAPDPVDTIVLEAYNNAVVLQPFEDGLCGVECKPSLRNSTTLLCRASNTLGLSGASDTIYDLCDFYVATSGCPGTSVTLGDLWITYDIELLNPYLPNFPVVSENQFSYAVTSANQLNLQSWFGSAYFNDTTRYKYAFPNYNVANFVSLLSGSTIQFTNQPPNARYLVVMSIVGGAFTAPAMTITTSGGALVTGLTQSPNAGATSTAVMVLKFIATFTSTTPSQTFQINSPTSVVLSDCTLTIVACSDVIT